MTFLRIVITLYLFDLDMIFSENRCPLSRIMLYEHCSADVCRDVTRLSARRVMRLQLLPEQ